MILDFEMQRVRAWRGRSWAETQNIVLQHVVRCRDESLPQFVCFALTKELAACELGERSRRVGAQSVTCREVCHLGKAQRRSEKGETVEHLTAVMALIFGVCPFAAETAVRRTRLVGVVVAERLEPRSIMGKSSLCAGKTETV